MARKVYSGLPTSSDERNWQTYKTKSDAYETWRQSNDYYKYLNSLDAYSTTGPDGKPQAPKAPMETPQIAPLHSGPTSGGTPYTSMDFRTDQYLYTAAKVRGGQALRGLKDARSQAALAKWGGGGQSEAPPMKGSDPAFMEMARWNAPVPTSMGEWAKDQKSWRSRPDMDPLDDVKIKGVRSTKSRSRKRR